MILVKEVRAIVNTQTVLVPLFLILWPQAADCRKFLLPNALKSHFRISHSQNAAFKNQRTILFKMFSYWKI